MPTLDYVLTERKVKTKTMKSIDKQIREIIKEHVKSNLPNEIFYTSWRNGGLSLEETEKRMYALRIKSYIALYNSCNKTRALMEEFTE